MKITLGNGEESETNEYVYRLATSAWFCFSRNAFPWMEYWLGNVHQDILRKKAELVWAWNRDNYFDTIV